MGNNASTSSGVTESETPNGTPTSTGETPETGTSGETPETPTTQSPSADELQQELERLKASLKRANAEAKQHREKASELDKLKADIEAAKLSETERLQKQLTDLQRERDDATRQLQESRVSAAVSSAAARLGFADPDDARRFLDMAELDFDERGNPTNTESLLKAVLKAKPYLVGGRQSNAGSGGATNPSRGASGASEPLSWDVISKMKPDEYRARRAEIQAWQAAHPFRYGQKPV